MRVVSIVGMSATNHFWGGQHCRNVIEKIRTGGGQHRRNDGQHHRNWWSRCVGIYSYIGKRKKMVKFMINC